MTVSHHQCLNESESFKDYRTWYGCEVPGMILLFDIKGAM